MYSEKRKILSIDVSANKLLSISRLLSLCQELSIEDTTLLGVGKDKTLDKGLLWVIGKQRYKINRLPEYDEEIELKSWPGDTLKALFPRYYQITKDDTILIEGIAIWSLIKKTTRNFILADDYNINIKGEKNGNELPFPKRLIPPKVKNTKVLKADYSNCDLNGHLNNASYVSFILSLIPVSFLNKHTPKVLEIDYDKEIKLGQEVIVNYGKIKNDYWFYNEYFTIKLGF